MFIKLFVNVKNMFDKFIESDLANVLRKFKWHLVFQIGISFLIAGELSLRPFLIKMIINKTIDIDHSKIFELLIIPVFLYLLLSISMVFFYRIYDLSRFHATPQIKKNIALLLTNQLLKQSHGFYKTNMSGSLTNKINDIIQGLPTFTTLMVHQLLSRFLALNIAVVLLWQTNHNLSIGLFLWSAFFIAWSVHTSKKVGPMAKESARFRSNIVGQFSDILSNSLTVRIFDGKKHELSRLSALFDKLTKAELKRDLYFFKVHSVQGLSFVIYQGCCLWWLVQGLNGNTLTTGDFALILTLNLLAIDCLWNFCKELRDASELFYNLKEAYDVIYSPFEIKEKKAANPIHIKKGKIVFKDVTFNYENDKPIFKRKSVVIEHNIKVGLVGFSGSGKSTFVSLILRHFDVQSGQILIDDHDIKDVCIESLQGGIAMIPQEPTLFNRSIYENIQYGNLTATKDEVIAAAKRASAHEFIECLPDGYNSLVGERGIKLSGGQKQRIAIARAILKDSPILILDEATSQLDSLIENEIQTNLAQIMINKTVIVIAHRLSTLLQMDRILVFEKGNIIQDGTHTDLLVSDGIYKKLWTQQVGGYMGLETIN